MDVSTLVQVVALICVSLVLLMGKKKKNLLKIQNQSAFQTVCVSPSRTPNRLFLI